LPHLLADQSQHPLLLALHEWCIVALKVGFSARARRGRKLGRAQQGAATVDGLQMQRLVCRVDKSHLCV
jgi:hypothetical protein